MSAIAQVAAQITGTAVVPATTKAARKAQATKAISVPAVVVPPAIAAVLFKEATAIASKRQRNFVLKVLSLATETATEAANPVKSPEDYEVVYTLALQLILSQEFPVVSQRRGAKWFAQQLNKVAALVK